MVNSKVKGKNYERQIAKVIAKMFGIKCRRTPCSGGLDIKGDVMSLSGIASRFNWEIKRQEKLNIWRALRQSINDAGSKIPVVVFSKNFEPDYIALHLIDFLNILKELEELNEYKDSIGGVYK